MPPTIECEQENGKVQQCTGGKAGEKEVWLSTCNSYMYCNMCLQVFRIAYLTHAEMVDLYESDSTSCLTAIQAHFPSLKRK